MEFSLGSFGILSTILIHLLTPAVGQESSAAPTVTSSAAAQTHTISVGIDHKFKPEVTQAEAGDLIEFQFFPPNHSVVRAEYEHPCIPYEMTGRGKTGFFSGFNPVDAILDDPPTWTLRINDTDPIFMYCSAPGSCINYGMVAVINPNASTSLEKQRQLAKDAAYMLNPGEPFPPEGSSVPPASSTPSIASSTPASSSSTSTSTETAAAAATSTSSHSALSKGAIAGIAVAGAAILALAAALFFFIGRSRSLKQEVHRTSTAPPEAPLMYPHHSFLAPKSDIGSSRSSAAVGPGHTPYDNMGFVGTMPSPPVGSAEPKTEYYVGMEESGYQRDDTRSPGSEAGYGNANLTTPRRHPSLAVNPNNPREMEAHDQRYTGWS